MAEIECPECGKSNFTNESYMKRHHKLVHGESLVETYECSIEDCDNVTTNPKFCSEECLGKARRKYEYGICKRSECDNEVYKFDYCSTNCANKESWKKRDNPAKRPKVRRKIAWKQMGDRNNMRQIGGHSEETKQKISESISGENHPHYGVTGKDHPSYGKLSGLKMQKVDKTGHTVRSNWEKDVDLMLYEADINYEYESRTFELSDELTYTPDFIVEDIVIEVKGWANSISKKRARIFMEKFPEYTYLVVGNKVPCDKFISWKERESLTAKLEEIKRNENLEA